MCSSQDPQLTSWCQSYLVLQATALEHRQEVSKVWGLEGRALWGKDEAEARAERSLVEVSVAVGVS